jgi:hypothetical protein
MKRAVPVVALCGLLPAPPTWAEGGGAGDSTVIASRRVASDFTLTADPGAAPWLGVAPVVAEQDRRGALVPGHRTEIRSRWTPGNLYLLYVCPYEELFPKPDPKPATETNKLWEWDVAEVFVGSDFQEIRRYKEFQVSPQGEWVDLAIDLAAQPPSYDWTWNSGFEVKARLDREKKVWYGEMRIPWSAIDARPPKAGQELRINFYRLQGPPATRRFVNWQPVNADSFHTPAAFGRLRLVE